MGTRYKGQLVLRSLPPQGGFSAPHIQSFAAAHWFHQLLEHWTADVQEETFGLDGDAAVLAHIAVGGSLERQGLSEAVQVFCAMTVEAATNLLAVLALGEEQFLATIERDSVEEKLKSLYRLLRSEELAMDDLLLTTACSLRDARNRFVHPKPQEGEWRSDPSGRRSDVNGARMAIHDTEVFLDRIRQIDRRYAMFLTSFLNPPTGR